MDLRHAADIVDDAANFLTTDQILPCEEGTAVAESLGTLGMNLREFAKSPLIAAAPELLKALEALSESAGEAAALTAAGLSVPVKVWQAVVDSLSQSSRALAKAKGVQS